MTRWEIIAGNLSKAGWSWGCVSAIDREGRTIWIVDAHGYGKRFVVRADEKLTGFVELERAMHQFAVRLSLTSCASDKDATPGEVWPSLNFSQKASAKYPGRTK